MEWTSDQILKLAPDSGSARSGRDLGAARKWVSLGCNDQACWGECQGSGSVPYQTQIDLGEPAFRCSCPSRKFPCKHALGLFLLYAEQRGVLSACAPPAWVDEWLTARAKKAEQRAKKTESDWRREARRGGGCRRASKASRGPRGQGCVGIGGAETLAARPGPPRTGFGPGPALQLLGIGRGPDGRRPGPRRGSPGARPRRHSRLGRGLARSAPGTAGTPAPARRGLFADHRSPRADPGRSPLPDRLDP